MTHVPDLVQVSKLDTDFYSDPEYTQHVRYVSGSNTKQRSIRKEEKWKRERKLGRGSFGVVWLERCIQGDDKGEVRAVKEIQKPESSDYYRELEAVALFSHTKYERCFVKSFGWYDDNKSIFITMEYLPNGDLHKYLNSPLPEKESQQIVFQILEGLQFMHNIGFAHRDLKPANLLVVCKGPDWWVKIADFGISKRAREGLTSLRTLTGTPAFTAPEVLGLGNFQPDNTSDDSYTNAVDIWSLGVITFLLLTGETLFQDQRRLSQYVAGSFTFPSDVLLANKISTQGIHFVRSLIMPKSEDRLEVPECLHDPWLQCLTLAPETQGENYVLKSLPTSVDSLVPEPSASWSTQDQISAQDTYRSIRVLPEMAIAKSDKTITQLKSETEIPRYWYTSMTLEGHSTQVLAVAFSPDGKQIVFGSGDRTIRLWDSTTGIERGTLEGHSSIITAVIYSPDGKQIASGSYDNTVRLWDSSTKVARGVLKGHSKGVNAVVFSPDGKQIASGSYDKTVRLWDSITGAVRGTLKGHSNFVLAVAFSPDGKQIASGSYDNTVRLWDSTTGAARGVLKGHSRGVNAVVFSPDGKQIASGSYDETVRFWDSITGAIRGTFKGYCHGVSTVVFSPDGKQIASGSHDKTVRLWDSTTGQIRGTLIGHSSTVYAVAFSPDGKHIASGSGDGTVRLWESKKWAAAPVTTSAI